MHGPAVQRGRGTSFFLTQLFPWLFFSFLVGFSHLSFSCLIITTQQKAWGIDQEIFSIPLFLLKMKAYSSLKLYGYWQW